MIIYVCLYVCHALRFSIFSVRVYLRNACTVNDYKYINRRVLCMSLFFFRIRYHEHGSKVACFSRHRGTPCHHLFPFIQNDQFNLDIWGPPSLLGNREIHRNPSKSSFLVFKIPIWIGEIITWP